MTGRVAVVGGGITGLAAALRLSDQLGPSGRVTLFEQGPVLGGKLRTGRTAGLVAERGAEAFLFRAPDGTGESAAVALARRVGLGDDLVPPEPVPPALWLDGALRRLPPGTLLGIPGDPAAVAAVATVATVDAGRDRDTGAPLLAPGEDLPVGELVRRRLGDQVVDRLVDPMLGGVYAGRADALSLAATMPGLAAAARTSTTLAGAVAAAMAASPRTSPVFTGIRGGLGRLVEAALAALATGGVAVRTGTAVRELAPAGGGWRLVVGSTRDAEQVEVDAVVLALPARPAGRLLQAVDTDVAAQLGALDYASVALVTLALPPDVKLPEWSGYLVPATEGLATKAVTFLSHKWAPLRRAGAPLLVRASVGRYGETGALRGTDPELVALVHRELATVVGELPPPVATHVQRWGGALPQYRPGHPDRVAAARAALPATLQLAGAGYDGVGIPACVASAGTAADRLLTAAAASGG